MKRKLKEVYQKREALLMKTHLGGKNLFQALNTWDGIRYSAVFLDWTEKETKELYCLTRKQLNTSRSLHPKSNVMRICIKRWYGGRGLFSVEKLCAAELRSTDFYLVNSEKELLELLERLENLEKHKIEGKRDYSNTIEQEKMYQLRIIKLHGQFKRNTNNKKSGKLWY